MIVVRIRFSPQRRKERREEGFSFLLSVLTTESRKQQAFAFSLPAGRQVRLG
jgi:hypothetical protein